MNDKFLLQILTALDSKGVKADYEKLKQEFKKSGIEIDPVINMSKSKTELQNFIKQFAPQLQSMLKNVNVDVDVKDIETSMKSVFKNVEKQAQQTSNNVQKAFTDLRKEAYQSLGTKSPEMSSMSDYYTDLSKKTEQYAKDEFEAYKINESYNQKTVANQKKLYTETEQAYKINDKFNNSLEITKNRANAAQKNLSAYVKTLNSNAQKEYSNEINDMSNAFEKVKQSGDSIDFHKATASVNNFKANMKDVGAETKSVTQILGDDIRKFAQWTISATVLMQTINTAKQLVSTVVELDKSIVDLQQATGFSQPQAKALLNTYIELGQQLGATGTEVANSADQWLRQGQSIADTNTLIKDSMILSKIGQIDSAQATQFLTSAMKGYKVEVSGVLGIIDKLSAIDVSSATSVGGLADAMSRTATGADLAGISMDKLLGMLAVVGEVTQKSMDSVGESFKTIFARMGNVKLGQMVDEDGNDITTEINDVEKILNKVDIKLRDSATEFRNFGSVLDDVGNNWGNFNEVEQNAIANAFAGVRQRENFTVLMENYSTSLKYAGISAQSSGNAMKKFSATEEGIEAKTKKVQASLQELSQDTLNSGVIKSFLDLSNVLINATDGIGLFNIALIATAGIMGAKTSLGLTSFANSLTVAIGKMGVASSVAETLGMVLSTAIPVAAIIGGVTGLVKLYDVLNVTSEELAESHSKSIEKVQDLSSEYENLTGTLQDLEDQQKTVQDKLKDLYKLRENQTITDAENQYLTQLESQNKKLEKQIEYEKVLQGIAGKKAEDAAVETLGEKTQSSIYTLTDKYGKQTAPLITDSEKVKENTTQIKALNQEIQNYNDVIGGIKLPEEQQAKYNKQLDYYNKALKDGLISEEQYNTYTKETKALLDGTLSYEDYAKKIEELKSKQSDYITENSTLVDSLQSVNDKIVSTSGANYDLKVSNQAIIDEAKKSATAFGELGNALDNEKNSAKDTFEPTIKSLSDVITSLNNASDAMSSLDSAYAKLKSKEKIDMSDITALQKSFGNVDGFDKFITVATSAKSVTSDVQNAFDDLVTTYVNTSGVLDGLNDTNKDMITSQLELMGVTNAESIVAERLAQQKVILADTGVDVSNATADEIISLLNETKVSDDTRLALVDLATQKLGVNNVAISTTGDIQNLLSLMAVSNAACESLSLLEKIKSGEVKGYGINPEFLTNLTKKAQEEVDAFYKGLGGSSSNVTYSGGDKTRTDKTKSDKSSKSSSSDDPYLDKFNAEKATLDHKLAMDEMTEKTYYDKLEKLNNKYFKKHQKKYLEQYRQNQEEVYKGRKQLDEEAKDKAEKKAEEQLKAEQDYIDGIIDKYQKSLSDINDTASDSENGSNKQISAYAKGLKTAGDEVSYLELQLAKLKKQYKDGKISQENYTEQLENLTDKLNEAKDSVKSYQDSIIESIKAQQEAQTDLVTDAYEKEKDAIEDRYDKELDSLNKIIDAKKKSLQADKEAHDYAKNLQEKTDALADINDRITDLSKAANSGDREAQAELKKLQEDRKKSQDELDELQADHKLSVEEDALDKLADDYQTQSDKNKTIDLDKAKTVYDDKLAKINSLYQREEELITHASEYTKKQFSESLKEINTQLADLGINTPKSTTNGLVNSYNDLTGISANGSNDAKILSILSNGNGKGLGTSELNKYISSNYGSQLSYSQMAELADLLGMSGVTTKNIVGDNKAKDEILKKLKKSGFKTGGVVNVQGSSSNSLSDLIRLMGEDTLIPVTNKERILTAQQNESFEKMINMMPSYISSMKLLTPNVSNLVPLNNNSSPIFKFDNMIQINGNVDDKTIAKVKSSGDEIIQKLVSVMRTK